MGYIKVQDKFEDDWKNTIISEYDGDDFKIV